MRVSGLTCYRDMRCETLASQGSSRRQDLKGNSLTSVLRESHETNRETHEGKRVFSLACFHHGFRVFSAKSLTSHIPIGK
jgi:hypothetical protein